MLKKLLSFAITAILLFSASCEAFTGTADETSISGQMTTGPGEDPEADERPTARDSETDGRVSVEESLPSESESVFTEPESTPSQPSTADHHETAISKTEPGLENRSDDYYWIYEKVVDIHFFDNEDGTITYMFPPYTLVYYGLDTDDPDGLGNPLEVSIEDDVVSATYTYEEHERMQQGYRVKVDEAFAEIQTIAPYYSALAYNDTLTALTVTVDRAGWDSQKDYENAYDPAFGFMLIVSSYHSYNDVDYYDIEFTTSFIDGSTGEVLAVTDQNNNPIRESDPSETDSPDVSQPGDIDMTETISPGVPIISEHPDWIYDRLLNIQFTEMSDNTIRYTIPGIFSMEDLVFPFNYGGVGRPLYYEVEDNFIELTYSRDEHLMMVDGYKERVQAAFAHEQQFTPYFLSLDSNEDMTELTVTVGGEAWREEVEYRDPSNEAGSFLIYAAYYRYYAELGDLSFSYIARFVDDATAIVLETIDEDNLPID